MKPRTTKRQAPTPETAGPGHTPETTRPRKPDLIQKALDCIEQKINQGEIRPTIGDLIKLLEIRQAHDTKTSVQACWYNPNSPEGVCPVCHRANQRAPRPQTREQPGSE